jgi:hypothetical protein
MHYQVNAAGQVAYQIRETASNVQSIRRSGPDGRIVADNGTEGLSDFNRYFLPPSTPENSPILLPKRASVAAGGTVVFRADSGGGLTNIYRSDDLVHPIVSNVFNGSTTLSARANVLGASDGHVLFTTTNSDNTIASLYLAADGTAPGAAIVSYSAATALPHAAAMTQQNRVAYYAPVGGDTTLNYFYNGTSTMIATEGTTVVDDTFTITQISTDVFSSGRSGAPMINDRGSVVYDALITSGGRQAMALIAWDATTQQNHVVVKADFTQDGSYDLSDVYTDSNGDSFTITSLLFNPGLGMFADTAKDALSDDNWLAFSFAYDADSQFALVEVQLPEPTTVSAFTIAGASLLVRRRRFRRHRA